MIDGGVAPGEEHDDSPWRPDAAVSFDHPPRRSFADHPGGNRDGSAGSTSGAASSTEERRPKSRQRVLTGLIATLVMVIAVGGASVVLLGGNGAPRGEVDVAAPEDDRVAVARDVGGDVTLGPDDTPLPTATACLAQRLPSTIEPLWNVELPDARRVISPVTVGDDSVVAIVGFDRQTANPTPSVFVVALDIADGRERWRAELRPSTGGHEIVGIVDRAVIVRSAAGPDMAYRRLFAFDEDTGELLWERGFRGDWSARVEAATGLVYVGVRRPAVSTTGDTEVEVLDPRAGGRVHVAAGSQVGLDPAGRLVTRLGDKVLATSPTDRDLRGVVVPADSPFATVGDDVVVANGNEPELTVYSGSGEPRTVPLAGSPRIDPPGFVVALEPLGGPSLIVTGGGAVHGAQLVDGAVQIRWRVAGIVVESAATDRGRSLLVATEGGARQRVIDSSTGRAIVDLDLRPGSYTTLGLASNGVVVQDYVDGDLFRVALDLDGRELWSLAGSGPIAIGRGVVVTVEESEANIGVAAAGDPRGARADVAECRGEVDGGAAEVGPVALGAPVSDR